MKQFVSIIALCMCCLVTSAQARIAKRKVMHYQQHDDKPIRFGFCVGLNVMDFTITHSYANQRIDSLTGIVNALSMGFQIQVVSAARLTDNLESRFLPGVSFGQRDLSFYKKEELHSKPQRLESSYIDLPLLMKYKSNRVNNYRAFLVGGLNTRFDLAKTYREEDDIYMDLKLFDVCYEFGGGFDFYFPYFKLSIELRGSWGIFNVLNTRDTPHPEFQNAFEKLRSTSYMLSFYIE